MGMSLHDSGQRYSTQQAESRLRNALTVECCLGRLCSALREVKIPPGPRLLILHHLERYRHVLKPGMPMPGYPPGAPAPPTSGSRPSK